METALKVCQWQERKRKFGCQWQERVVSGKENGPIRDTFRLRHATAHFYIEWGVCAELHQLAKSGLECGTRRE